MPVHESRMILPGMIGGDNLEESIARLALNNFSVIDALLKIQHRVSPEYFYILLRVFDCKCLHGDLITKELFTTFAGNIFDYTNYVLVEAPCAFCHKTMNMDEVLEKYNCSVDSRDFFDKKFGGAMLESDQKTLLDLYDQTIFNRLARITKDNHTTLKYQNEINTLVPLEFEENPFSIQKSKEYFLIENGVLTRLDLEE
ncbi:MAG: hypothetical protein WCG01_01380 [bacterium]